MLTYNIYLKYPQDLYGKHNNFKEKLFLSLSIQYVLYWHDNYYNALSLSLFISLSLRSRLLTNSTLHWVLLDHAHSEAFWSIAGKSVP